MWGIGRDRLRRLGRLRREVALSAASASSLDASTHGQRHEITR